MAIRGKRTVVEMMIFSIKACIQSRKMLLLLDARSLILTTLCHVKFYTPIFALFISLTHAVMIKIFAVSSR